MNDFEHVEVLLVEDNQFDAEMTIRAFKKGNFNNKLFWVKDGVEALEFIRCTGPFSGRDASHWPRIVLLDLKMPRLNGIDVLRELKGDPDTMKIPIVVMTSSDQDRDITESYRLGVNGYVTKPVQVDAFIEAVNRIGAFWLGLNLAPTE